MIIAGEYSFKDGKSVIENQFSDELQEVKQVIAAVDSSMCKVKMSKEKNDDWQDAVQSRITQRSIQERIF
jgi:hypothetical protein